MRTLFLLATVLAVAQAAEPERWLLEVNFGDFYFRGVMFGDRLVVDQDALSIGAPAHVRKLSMLERQWIRVHIKDVDVTCSLGDDTAIDIETDFGKRTVLLFCKSVCSNGDEEQYVGTAYLYDKGKLTRGGFTKRTVGWDSACKWPERYLESKTGCPDCDRLLNELKEGR